MKKYKLVKHNNPNVSKDLYQIKALIDIPSMGIKKGDLGGYVESENNLSHKHDAWVFDNAKVFGNAKVLGNAQVYDSAQVFGNAKVFGESLVLGNAQVYGNAKLYGYAWVFGESWVLGNAQVYGKAQVYGSTKVYGKALVYGDAHVYGDARIRGFDEIEKPSDYAVIQGFAHRITVTANSIHVGCGDFTPDELDNDFTDPPKEELEAMKYMITGALEYILSKE